jgi:hypothetical protein
MGHKILQPGLAFTFGGISGFSWFKGQVLLAVKPHAAALSNERLDLHCSQCFAGNNNSSLKRCTKCQTIYYCDSVGVYYADLIFLLMLR